MKCKLIGNTLMFIGVLVFCTPIVASLIITLPAWHWFGFGMIGGVLGGLALVAGATLSMCGGK